MATRRLSRSWSKRGPTSTPKPTTAAPPTTVRYMKFSPHPFPSDAFIESIGWMGVVLIHLYMNEFKMGWFAPLNSTQKKCTVFAYGWWRNCLYDWCLVGSGLLNTIFLKTECDACLQEYKFRKYCVLALQLSNIGVMHKNHLLGSIFVLVLFVFLLCFSSLHSFSIFVS